MSISSVISYTREHIISNPEGEFLVPNGSRGIKKHAAARRLTVARYFYSSKGIDRAQRVDTVCVNLSVSLRVPCVFCKGPYANVACKETIHEMVKHKNIHQIITHKNMHEMVKYKNGQTQKHLYSVQITKFNKAPPRQVIRILYTHSQIAHIRRARNTRQTVVKFPPRPPSPRRR
jgi:hypothetical protein